MRHLGADERPLVEAIITGMRQARWATWMLSVGTAGAEVDEEGEIHLPCSLVSFSEEGTILGMAETRRALLHLADLGAVARAEAYFRAMAASLSGLAEARGWRAGDALGDGAFAEVMPGASLLEDLSLQSFDDFLEKLERPAWLDAGGGPDPEDLPDPRDLSGTQPLAQDPENEAELASWPHARWPYVRYARWLSERMDPRGALIAAQFGAEAPDPRARRHDDREARGLLTQHARYFLGPFAPRGGGDPFDDQVVFLWKLGFIERIELHLDLASNGPAPADILAGALALPSSRFARAIVLSVASAALGREDRHPLPRWTDALVASGGHPRVRTVVIRPAPAFRDDPHGDPVEGPPILTESEDLDAIRSVFPQANVVP